MKTLNSFRYLTAVFGLMALITLSGCKKEDNGHDPFRSKITMSCADLPNVDFNADEVKIPCPVKETSYFIRILASVDVSWEISVSDKDKQIISCSPKEGSGYSGSTMTIQSNTTGKERVITILVYDSLNKKARKFIITQPAIIP